MFKTRLRTSSPLRIRVDLRDQFDAPNSEVQKAFAALEEIVGLELVCHVDWDLLYNVLEVDFPDKATFVPSIARVVVGWCDVLSTRLEDERFSAWTDQMVGKLESAGSIKLHIQTSDGKRPTTSWSTDQSGFLLSFSNTNLFRPDAASSGFETDFQNLFGIVAESGGTSTQSLPIRSKRGSVDDKIPDEDRAQINKAGDALGAGIDPLRETTTRCPSIAVNNILERIPNVNTLASPDLLLNTLTPYIIHVRQGSPSRVVESGSNRIINQGAGRLMGINSSTSVEQGAGKVVVQGTHEPSLQFLYDYLSRWSKKDRQDIRKSPFLSVTLKESHFGFGLTYDTLVIEPFDADQDQGDITVNAAIILTLIENILGYRRLPSTTGTFWEFQRDSAFE